MNDPPRRVENPPLFLTVQEAADLLRVKKRSLYRLVTRQQIPYRRIGRAIRFERNELLAWTNPKLTERNLLWKTYSPSPKPPR